MECILYYDVYKIIYNPFYPTRNRFCLYYFLLITVFIVNVTIQTSQLFELQLQGLRSWI